MSGRRRQLTVERSPVIAWNVQTFHGAPYPDMPAAAAISPVVPAASDPYGRCWQNQVDAGSCFPYFANIYSSSLPPPSSFRVQPSCVTNLGQFWPPTPPPDGCGRYEASNNFYFCPPPMTPVFSHNETIPQSIHGSLPRLSHYSHIIETPKEHNIHSSGLKLENPLSPKCSFPHMTELCPPVSKYEAQNSVQVPDSGPKKPDAHQSTLCSQVSTNREKSAPKTHYSSCNYMECEGRNHSGDLIRGSDKENIHNSSSYNSYNPDHRSANGKLKQKNCEITKENLNLLHFKNSNFQPNQNIYFSSSQNSMLSNNYKEHTSLQCVVAPSALDSLNKNASAMEVSNVHCGEEIGARRGIENSIPVSQPAASLMTTVSAIPVSGLSISSASSSMIARSNCSHHSSHVPRSGYNACSSIPLQIQMFSDTPISHRKSCCFSPPHALSRTFFQHPVTEVPKSNLKQNSYMAFGSNYNSSPLKNVYFSYLESENIAKYASKGSKLIGKNMSLNSEKYANNVESSYDDAKLMPTATEKISNSCDAISNSDGTSNNYMSCVVECPLEHQQKCISLSGIPQRSEKRKFEEVMFVSDQKKKSRRVKVKTEKNETADCRFQKSSEYVISNHDEPSISNALNLSMPKSPKSEPQDIYSNQDKISLNSGHLASSSASISCGIPVNTIVPLEDFQNFNGNNDFNDVEKDMPLSYCPILPRVSEANISNLEYASVGYSTVQSDSRENVASEALVTSREMPESKTQIKSGTNVSNDFNPTTAASEDLRVKTDSNASFHAPGTSHKPGNCCMMQNCCEKSKKYEYRYFLEQDKVEKENLTTSNIKSSDSRSLDLTCGSSSLCESDDKPSRDSNFAMFEVLPVCVEKSNEGNKSIFLFNPEDLMGVNKETNFEKNGDFNNSPELVSKCIQSELSVRTQDLVTDSALLLLETKFENSMIRESELKSETSPLQDDSKKCASLVRINLPPEGTNFESNIEQNADQNTDLCHSDELCCGDSHPHEVVTDENVSTSKKCKYTNVVNLGEKLNEFSVKNCDQQSNALEFSENHGLNLLIDSIEQMEKNQNEDNAKSSLSLTKSYNSGKLEPGNYEENDYSGSHLLPYSDAPTPAVCGLDLLCALVEQHYFSEFNVEVKSDSLKNVNSSLIDSSVVKCENTNSRYSLNQAAEELSESAELEMRKRLAELQRKYKEKQKELARLKSKKIFSRMPNKGGKTQSCKNLSVMNEQTSICSWTHSHMQTDGNNLGPEFSSCSREIPPVEKSLKSEAAPTLDNELFMDDDICETRKMHDSERSNQSTNKHSKCGYEEKKVPKEICNTKKQNSRFSNVLGLNEDRYITRTKLRNSKLCSAHLRKNQNYLNMDKIIVPKTKQVAKKGSLNIDSTRVRSTLCRVSKTRLQKTLPGGVQREKLQKSEDYYNPSALNLPRFPKRVKGLSNFCVVTPTCEGIGSPDRKCSRPVSNKRKADNPRKFSPLKQENVTETLVTKQLRNRILINEESSEQNEQDGTNGISEELFDAFRKCHLGEDPKSSNTSCKIVENAVNGDVIDSNLRNNCLDLIQELSMLKPLHLSEKQRVVAMEDGLFYAGHIKVIQPPDVYGIVLDGERGTKPHVFSREEIMKAAMVEVKPKSIDELPEKTRVCAYWSQQYRCLYPGTVAKVSKAKTESTEPWVFVEFDDGDSGQIPIKNIRLLPHDLKLSFADEEVKDIPSEQAICSPESSTIKLPSNKKRKAQREKCKIHQKHKSIKKELPASSKRTALLEMPDSNDDLRNNSEGNTISSHTSDSQSTENCTETQPYTSDLLRKSPRNSLTKMSKRKGSKAKSKEIVLLEKNKKHKEKRKHHHHHHHHHRHHHHRHHRHCHHHHHCKKHKRRKKGDLNSTVSQGNTDLVIPSSSIPDKNLSCKLSCHSLEGDCNDSTGHSSLELPQCLEKSSSTDTGTKTLQQKCLDEECESKPVLRRNHRSIQRNSAKFNRGIA